MINGGDEFPRREDVTSGIVASPDLSDAVGSKSDGNNASSPSRYSSREESEFKRYCSADLAVGTSNLSSSMHCTDCLDSEFGSFRSLGDEKSSHTFSSRGRLDWNLNLSARFSQVSRNCDDLNSKNNRVEVCVDRRELDTGPVFRDDPLGALDDAKPGTFKEGILFETRNASLFELGSGEKDIQSSQLNSDDEMILGGKEDEEGEEGELLKYGCPEDEDSSYNYGSDDDSGKNLPYLRNIQYDMGGKDEGNPFLMNSSIAFGADDWNDFVEEMEEISANPLIFDTLHKPREVNLETQGHPPDLPSEGWVDLSIARKTGEGKDLKDLPLFEEQIADPDKRSRTREACPANPSGPQESAETACREPEEDVWDSSQRSNQGRDADESEEYLNSCSITNIFQMNQEPVVEKVHLELEECPKDEQVSEEVGHPCVDPEKLINTDPSQHVEDIDMKLDPLSDSTMNELLLRPVTPLKIKMAFPNDEMQNSSELMAIETEQRRCSTNLHLSMDIYEERTSPTKVSLWFLNVELLSSYSLALPVKINLSLIRSIFAIILCLIS